VRASNKRMQQTGGALISVRRPQLIRVFDGHPQDGRIDERLRDDRGFGEGCLSG
jgi:hypothetical protein